jgi:hypothetical protein
LVALYMVSQKHPGDPEETNEEGEKAEKKGSKQT